MVYFDARWLGDGQPITKSSRRPLMGMFNVGQTSGRGWALGEDDGSTHLASIRFGSGRLKSALAVQ
jgi:hypothetical protein